MNRILYIFMLFIIIQTTVLKTKAEDFYYILNETQLNDIYQKASIDFQNTDIRIYKEAFGIILRYKIDLNEYTKEDFYTKNYDKLTKIKYFLAKIKNLAIIEVHLDKNSVRGIKSWELSTVIANQIESILIELSDKGLKERIKSIGYGEFLPAKNTSNKGVKKQNRVDIIILCNISGE